MANMCSQIANPEVKRLISAVDILCHTGAPPLPRQQQAQEPHATVAMDPSALLHQHGSSLDQLSDPSNVVAQAAQAIITDFDNMTWTEATSRGNFVSATVTSFDARRGSFPAIKVRHRAARSMDLDALLSASEFRSAVNEWLDDLDTEDRDAATANLPAYRDSTAVVSAPLSSIFGSALPPLLDDDSLGCN
ncbi:TPA: hypothetical protein ACH3X1_010874 [Trebouxia sp. C0004]